MPEDLLAGIPPEEDAKQGRGTASLILGTMDQLLKVNITMSFKSQARIPKYETKMLSPKLKILNSKQTQMPNHKTQNHMT